MAADRGGAAARRVPVVHGELSLDHVMVDRDGHPVVIDIENLLYVDVEW